jgi:charged multivesicular body protein 2A
MLDKAMRELDRERTGLQTQEKKLIAEIKKMAKEGQLVGGDAGPAGGHGGGAAGGGRRRSGRRSRRSVSGARLRLRPPLLATLPPPTRQDAVKVMAKSLIRNRHAVTKLHGLKSQLQAISLRIQVPAGALGRTAVSPTAGCVCLCAWARVWPLLGCSAWTVPHSGCPSCH